MRKFSIGAWTIAGKSSDPFCVGIEEAGARRFFAAPEPEQETSRDATAGAARRDASREKRCRSPRFRPASIVLAQELHRVGPRWDFTQSRDRSAAPQRRPRLRFSARKRPELARFGGGAESTRAAVEFWSSSSWSSRESNTLSPRMTRTCSASLGQASAICSAASGAAGAGANIDRDLGAMRRRTSRGVAREDPAWRRERSLSLGRDAATVRKRRSSREMPHSSASAPGPSARMIHS